MTEAMFSGANWFAAFLESTDQKANIQSHFSSIIDKLGETLPQDKPLQVLDIGAGSGEMTILALDMLASKGFEFEVIAIDPSDKMTDICATKLAKAGYAECSEVITDSFFDHETYPDKGPEAIHGKKFDLIIGSHILYYADDVEAAMELQRSYLSENGLGLNAHQAKAQPGVPSDMHELRNQHSFTALTKRTSQADTEPNCSDHIKTDVAIYRYGSHLYFPAKYSEYLEELKTTLAAEQPIGACLDKIPAEEQADFTRMTNVLQFIMRTGLEDLEPDAAVEFLNDVENRIGANGKHDGKPHILIGESFVFTTGSERMRENVQTAVKAAAAANVANTPTNDRLR